MAHLLPKFLGGLSPALRRRLALIYAVLLLANLGAWAWALMLFRGQPLLLGTALLAYGFGLRHAVDGDHIAAIDNVTRKLMQEGKRPVGVGFCFALGHSAVVAAVVALLALTAGALAGGFDTLRSVGDILGSSISALFLFLIGAMNLVIFLSVLRSFRHVRAGGTYREEDLHLLLSGRGLMARLFRPLFRLIRESWHMLPLGILFGLGFDTATEIGLISVSSAEAAHGVSVWSVMVFPALFAAGMTLVDTTDGVLMLGAYGWAAINPIRKLYYNMTITLASVLVACLIGGLEVLGIAVDQFSLTGGVWDAIGDLNDNLNGIGFVCVGIFVATWAISAMIYRVRRFDEAAGAVAVAEASDPGR